MFDMLCSSARPPWRGHQRAAAQCVGRRAGGAAGRRRSGRASRAGRARGPPHAGGEANLVLPDLGTVDFHGINGRTLLMSGLVVCLGGLAVRPRDLHAAQEPAGPQVDAGHLRADLRDLQDVSHHAGQVHPPPRDLHRRDHGDLLRRAPAHGRAEGHRHPALQPDRHRRQLRRGVVRHPRQHVRQLARGVRRPEGHAVSDLRDSAQRRDEHRHAAHQRRAVPDALHPALHSRRLRRRLFHRLRHRRVARRLGAQHRRRHLHQDRRHRLRPDEDRLQHQGRRRAQSGRHRRLHRRQRGRLGRAERRRLRDLRRDRCRADLVHPGGGDRRLGPGPAPRLDLRHARRHDRRQRRVVPAQRRVGEGQLRRRQDDELRDAADPPGVADVDRLGHPHLCRLVLAHPDPRRQRQSLVAALDRHHLRHAGGRDHPGARQGLHLDRVQPREGSRDLVARGRTVAQHPARASSRATSAPTGSA